MKEFEYRVVDAMEKNDRLDIDKTERVFEYLDALRDSGEINMFGARPYVMSEFEMNNREAKAYLMAWMGSFA